METFTTEITAGPQPRPFPKYMVSTETGCVFLMSGRGKGTKIVLGNSKYAEENPAGAYCESWAMSELTDFVGVLTTVCK